MLGFSPLASAPLADDGVIIYLLNGNDITTGSPVVGASSVAQDQDLTADSLTTGSPVVVSSTVVQEHVLAANDITTGQPTVGETNAQITVVISIEGNNWYPCCWAAYYQHMG